MNNLIKIGLLIFAAIMLIHFVIHKLIPILVIAALVIACAFIITGALKGGKFYRRKNK